MIQSVSFIIEGVRVQVFKLAGAPIVLCVLLLLFLVEVVFPEEQVYVCYSLKRAESMLQQEQAVDPIVSRLGYITEPVAVVFDRQQDDLILVGKRIPDNPELYLDDWVVALRSFLFKGGLEDPGVSIDPADYWQESEDYIVSFFGGARNTRFGEICFEADYLLKKMSLGLAPTGSRSVISPWHLMQTKPPDLDREPSDALQRSRSYFWPKLVRVLYGRNAAVVEVCQVGVREAAVPAPGALDAQDDESYEKQFADSLTKYYEEVSKSYPVLRKLRNLYGLYGLAKWVWSLPNKPDLNYWLNQHQVVKVEMPRFVEPLRQGFGGIAFGYQVSGEARFHALAILMRDGDPSAFARMVPSSRPEGSPLVWSFKFDDQNLSLDTTSEHSESIELIARGEYLARRGEFERALLCLNEAIDNGFRTREVLCQRALVATKLNDFSGALDDCNEAIQSDSTSAKAWYIKGLVHEAAGDADSALADLERAISLSSTFESARLAHARLLMHKGRLGGALAAFNMILENNPNSEEALLGKADLHERLGEPESTWTNLNKIIAADLDYEYQDIALKKLVNLKKEGQIDEASPSINNYPFNAFKWSRPMWEFSFDLRTSYDQGMVYSPPSAILIGKETFRISFPVGMAFVFWNRLRLEGELPLELVITPYEVPGYFQTRRIIAMTGGVQSAYFGLNCQILDGLWNRPHLIASLHFVSPCIKKVFEGYLSGEKGYSKGAVPFGENFWYGIAGLQSELPISSAARIVTYTSYLYPFISGVKGNPGYGLGVKGRIIEGAKRVHLGFIVDQLWNRYSDGTDISSKHTRCRLILEEVDANSLRTWSFGFGQVNYKGDFEDTRYIFASVNLGKHIWLKRGWF